MLFPTKGPHLVLIDEYIPYQSNGLLYTFNIWLQKVGSNGVDSFPSTHMAISVYLVCMEKRYVNNIPFISLLVCLGVMFSTVFFHYHYVIDLLSGGVIGALIFHINNNKIILPLEMNIKKINK
jgi:membrane-associated phospholipid phosphatase